jgi:hypothetical protein
MPGLQPFPVTTSKGYIVKDDFRFTDGERKIIAGAVDLVGRTGAKEFNLGYLHEDVPTDEAGWYAYAQYQGARITCDGQSGPVMAVDGLVRMILDGAKCMTCGRLVTTNPEGAYAHDSTMMDGTKWSAEDQAKVGVCFWRRDGEIWQSSCKSRKPKSRLRHRRRR